MCLPIIIMIVIILNKFLLASTIIIKKVSVFLSELESGDLSKRFVLQAS